MAGFSILQPTLGAQLSFLPAVGSKELDVLIDAYLPGPASAQEKRAAVALEFFDHSARTGDSFKYFSVPVTPTPSPAMSDCTYASSSCSSSGQPSTPATPKTSSRPAKRRRPETTDFSHLPGMKIITLDGQDVTNHASRGCKTKEQRDHAHLMRILKACDACKKKKIRCDPSHRKRSASQVDSSAKAESVKPAKKSKKTTPAPATPAPPDLDHQPDWSTSLPDLTTSMAEWDQYFTFNEPIDATLPQDFYSAVPQDFNFFFEPETQFSPATSGSSAVSPAQPQTPTSSGVFAAQAGFIFDDPSFASFAPPVDAHDAMLPYMASCGVHGSNYVDFNLFSPSASFVDEEPRKLKAGDVNMVQEGVSPSTSSAVLVSTAGNQAGPWLTRPMPVSSPVCKPCYPFTVPLLDALILTLEKAPQVLDVQQQQQAPQPETLATPPPRPSPSPATAVLSTNPGRQGQRVPSSGLTSSSADQPRTRASLGPQVPSAHPLPTVATDVVPVVHVVQHTAPVTMADRVRRDTLLQQQSQPAADCTDVHAKQTCTPRSTGLPARSILSSPLAQLPESMAESPLAAAARPLPTPVRQLLAGSTTTTTCPLSVVPLTQLAVFGLVSLLLMVAVTAPHLQQQQQLQYPVFAAIMTLSTMTMSLSSAFSSPGQQAFFGKPAALDSVRSLLRGPSPLPSPWRRRLGPSNQQHGSRPSTMTTAHRAMACF